MNYDMKECETRIRQIRINRGFTQESVARMLNVDQSYYGRIETGKRGCPIEILVRLSNLFRVSLDYLILGKSDNGFLGETDRTQLKSDVEALIEQLGRLKASL